MHQLSPSLHISLPHYLFAAAPQGTYTICVKRNMFFGHILGDLEIYYFDQSNSVFDLIATAIFGCPAGCAKVLGGRQSISSYASWTAEIRRPYDLKPIGYQFPRPRNSAFPVRHSRPGSKAQTSPSSPTSRLNLPRFPRHRPIKRVTGLQVAPAAETPRTGLDILQSILRSKTAPPAITPLSQQHILNALLPRSHVASRTSSPFILS